MFGKNKRKIAKLYHECNLLSNKNYFLKEDVDNAFEELFKCKANLEVAVLSLERMREECQIAMKNYENVSFKNRNLVNENFRIKGYNEQLTNDNKSLKGANNWQGGEINRLKKLLNDTKASD